MTIKATKKGQTEHVWTIYFETQTKTIFLFLGWAETNQINSKNIYIYKIPKGLGVPSSNIIKIKIFLQELIMYTGCLQPKKPLNFKKIFLQNHGFCCCVSLNHGYLCNAAINLPPPPNKTLIVKTLNDWKHLSSI